ncbi:hypothetical protein DPMN_035551 [Dreissena polymorpha]|uniref:Peptidase C14 caspase domain-containing protein n=1 Tax=Dreissena polymorpha TaxID=45954 RepID=A0A9D4MC25_DREPO|nr:hypothetical protein DPMN_035551 [Dreissena polymorpha]
MMDMLVNSTLPPIPKGYEPAEQLLVNVNPHAVASVYKCYNDMLIMTSSPSGMLAWRSNMTASWMIRFIKEEIEKSTEREINLTKVLTKVAFDMANQETYSPTKNPVQHGMKSVFFFSH